MMENDIKKIKTSYAEEELKAFSQNLKAARESAKLSQKELAQQIGITSATISAYENGVKNPSLEIALGLAKALNISVDDLCGTDLKVEKKIETYGQAIQMISALTKSQALRFVTVQYGDDYLDMQKEMEKFFSGFAEITNLFQNGTINEELYDLWVQNETKKYQDKKIIEPSSHKEDDNDYSIEDTDLPF